MHRNALAAILIDSLVVSGVSAAVSPEQAARLGKDLTPTGAEMGGAGGFKMLVYSSKRDYVYPDYIVGNTVRNATGATMVADGQKLENNLNGKPIPGEYENGVKENEKYLTPKGMARSGALVVKRNRQGAVAGAPFSF